MFRPHRAIIRLTKKCLWTLIITICLRAFEVSKGLQFFFTYNPVCSGGACVCVCVCVAVSCRSFSLLASSVCLLNWLLILVQWLPRPSSPQAKRLGVCCWPPTPPPSKAEVKNDWNWISTVSYPLMSCTATTSLLLSSLVIPINCPRALICVLLSHNTQE